MTKYVAYYRVSTKRQGVSGLGLDAQKTSIENYIRSNAGEVVGHYTEVESGKRNDRKVLQTAIQHCKRIKGVLLIARLDRLARNLHFITSLMESGIQFIAVDNPHANKMTIHILASIAQYEGEVISLRVRSALQEAKKRGVVLGNPSNLNDEASSKGRREGREAQARRADQFACEVSSLLVEYRSEGMSYARIADRLNAEGVLTARNTQWYPMTVKKVLERVAA